MGPDQLIALGGLVLALIVPLASYVAARAGTNAALNVHFQYLRRDVDRAARQIDAAHWRLDQIDAPAAPLDA